MSHSLQSVLTSFLISRSVVLDLYRRLLFVLPDLVRVAITSPSVVDLGVLVFAGPGFAGPGFACPGLAVLARLLLGVVLLPLDGALQGPLGDRSGIGGYYRSSCGGRAGTHGARNLDLGSSCDITL